MLSQQTAFLLSLLAFLLLPNVGQILTARFYQNLRRLRLYASVASISLLLAAMFVLLSYASDPLTGAPVFLFLTALSFMCLTPVTHDPYDMSPCW